MEEDGRLEDMPETVEKESLAAGQMGGEGVGARGSGGPSGKIKVFESRKENKRRLILSDPESDEDSVSMGRRGQTGIADSHNGNAPAIIRKKSHGSSVKKEVAAAVKRTTRLDAMIRPEDADIGNMSVGKIGMERKRTRRASFTGGEDGEISVKKLKTDTMRCRRDKVKHMNANKRSVDSPRRGEKEEVTANRVLGSKALAIAARERESLSAKRIRDGLRSTRSPEVEKSRSLDHSSRRMVGVSKDNNSRSAGEQISASSDGKGTRVQGKGGVLMLLPSNKKVGRHVKTIVGREAEASRKNLGSLSISDKSKQKHASILGDESSLKKSASSSMLAKGHVDQGNLLSAKGSKSHEVRTEVGNLSTRIKSKSGGNFGNKNEVKDKGASRFNVKTPFPFKNSSKLEKVSRNTEKQKLRDHIKNMLLDAGWTIEMRPRRDRDYEDAVYVSPKGTGYWSITKAYSVLQEQFNQNVEAESAKSNELFGKLSRASTRNAQNNNGTTTLFSVIPVDVLSILKRNVVNKRRSKEELENLQEGSSGTKKATDTTSTKLAKREVKGRSNENGVSGSVRKKNKKRRGCALLVRHSNKEADSEADGYVPYAGKRTILSWMIDFGTAPANGKVKYMNKRHTRAILEGWITRDGIHCSCCSKILTVWKFEIHAGSKLHQPYENIFVEESGVSLLQCQLDAWEKQEESERQAFHSIDVNGDDPNDDTCGICGDGGDLICCDGCPSTFHLSCLGIQMLPPDEWHCTNCTCRFCGVANNSTTQDNGVTCSLLLSCGQCEEKYHQTCVRDVDVIPTESNSPLPTFCGRSCRTLFGRLQKLLGVQNDLEAGFSWTLIQRFDNDPQTSCCGLAQRAECNSKIAVALAVMDECFLPIIDQRSGINLIHNVLYNCGSNFSRLDYSGFYTFVLEKGDEIISAAAIRIHGTKLAEMPFIGTRDIYRRQGMCRRLLNAIEMALRSLNVEKLVIPAISDLVHTWTEVFGFKPLPDFDKQEIKSMNMLVFPGTGLLQKALLVQEGYTIKEEVGVAIENGTNHSDAPAYANGSLEHSSVGYDLHASDGVAICSHKVEENAVVKPHCVASDGSVRMTTEVSEPSDMPSGSDLEVSSHKTSDVVLDGECSVQDDLAYHDKTGPKFNIDADSGEHKIQLPCKVTVKTESNTEDIKRPLEATTGTSCADSVQGDLAYHDKTGLKFNINADSGEHKIQLPCKVTVKTESNTEDIKRPLEATMGTSCADSVQGDLAYHVKTGPKFNIDADSGEHKIQLPCKVTVKTESNTEDIRRPLEATMGTSCADSVLSNQHGSVGHDTDEVKVKVVAREPGNNSFVMDSGQCTSAVHAQNLDVLHQDIACESIMCQASEMITQHIGPVARDGLQDSDGTTRHQDFESLQCSSEFSGDSSLLSAKKARLQTVYELDKVTCMCSTSNPHLHATVDDRLQNTSETKSGICSMAESPLKYHTSEMDNESVHDASPSDILTCGGKSSEFHSEFPDPSDAPPVFISVACVHGVHRIRKDPPMTLPHITKSSPFNGGILPDTHDAGDVDASVAPDHRSPNEASVS